MKEIIIVALSLMISTPALSGDGRNPCKWESYPKPYCTQEEKGEEVVSGPALTSSEKRGGDNQ